MDNKLYRVHEVAEMLGLNRWTLRNWCERNRIIYNRTTSGQRVWSYDMVMSIKRDMMKAGNNVPQIRKIGLANTRA